MKRLAARLLARLATASGWTRRLRAKRHREQDFRTYILAYHDVTLGQEKEGIVSATRLDQHLAFLRRHFRLCGLTEASERIGGTLDEDLLVLTFDDGYRDNYHVAWPILRQHQTTATIFLTTGFLDGEEMWFDFARRALSALAQKPEHLDEKTLQAFSQVGISWQPREPIEPVARQLKYLHPDTRQSLLDALRALELELSPSTQAMTWDEARELHDAGIELGGHTVRHPILSTLDANEQEEEIRLCRDRMSEELGAPPLTFAFPNGSPRDFNSHTLEALKLNGFITNCTMVRGSNRLGADRLQLRRLGVGHDPNFLLEARLAGLFDQEMRRRLRLGT